MKRLVLCISLFQLALASCPSGFELAFGGKCISNYTRISTYSDKAAAAAIAKCKEVNAQPIIIHNDEDQGHWKNHVDQHEYVHTVIGLVCNTNTKKWEWADGSPMDYKPPNYWTDLDKDCTSVYSGVSWMIDYRGVWSYWGTYHYGPTATDVFCATQLHQPILPADGCYNFKADGDDGICYQVGATAESWTDAQLSCEKLGANFASIHNANENSFVRRLAVSNGAVHNIYLGATVSGKGGSFGWVDGSAWDYDNFAPGFPRAGFGDCITMDTSSATGQWMNVDCATKIPVACAQKPIPPPEIDQTCKTDTWTEGAAITSPGFPFNASIPCVYYLMADAGKKVKLEVALLEANSCCDFLTIYDGYTGGRVLTNLTGAVSKKTYTTTSSNIMKVTWNPNGGVNVRGVAMTFRGV